MKLQKTIWFLFSAWCQVVASFAQEVTVSDATINLKTTTNETQTSTIDGVELASTTKQVSAIESTQKVKRIDIASESKKISVITIPFSPFQKIDDNSFLLLGKAGTYNVILTSFDEGWQSLAEVVIGDQPGPGPDPQPTDVFSPGGWVILIEETSERTAATAAITGNLTWWSSVKNRGYSWRFYDRDQASANDLKHAEKVGLPALLFVEPTGKVWNVIKLPKTVGEIDKFLKPAAAEKPRPDTEKTSLIEKRSQGWSVQGDWNASLETLNRHLQIVHHVDGGVTRGHAIWIHEDHPHVGHNNGFKPSAVDLMNCAGST